jgi:biopolymer transport protein ExbD
MSLLIIIAAGSLLLLEIAWVAIVMLQKQDRLVPRAIHSPVAAAILAPMTICVLFVVAVHLKHVAPFALLDISSLTAEDPEPVCGTLCRIGSLRFFSGIALMALSAFGILTCILAWKKSRDIETRNRPLVVIGLGINLVAGLVGAGVYGQEQAVKATGQAWAAPAEQMEKQFADALQGFNLPAYIQISIWVGIFAICSLLLLLLRKRKVQIEAKRSFLAASILFLAIGAVAFAFTRGHAHDVEKNLPSITARAYQPDTATIPEEIHSGVYGIVRSSCGAFRCPKINPDLDLPESTATIGFRWAVGVEITQSELLVEGKPIARLENRRFTSDSLSKNGKYIKPLYRLLNKLKKSKKNTAHDDTVINLQADRDLPFETIDLVRQSAALAGSPNFRLIVSEENPIPSPFSKKKATVINASMHRRDLPELDADELAEKDGPEIPPEGLPGPEYIERFAQVKVEDIALEIPGSDAASPRINLKVEISSDGFIFSECRARTDEPIPESTIKIPKVNDKFDFVKLAQKTKQVHDKYKKSDTVYIVPEKEISYQTVIKTMDVTRERIINEEINSRTYMFTNAVLYMR